MTSKCIISRYNRARKRISTSLNQFLIVSILASWLVVIIAQSQVVAARPTQLFERINNRPGGRFYHNEQHFSAPWPRARLGPAEGFQLNQSNSHGPQQTAFRLAMDLPSVLRNEAVTRDVYHLQAGTRRPSTINQPAMIYSRPWQKEGQASYTWSGAFANQAHRSAAFVAAAAAAAAPVGQAAGPGILATVIREHGSSSNAAPPSQLQQQQQQQQQPSNDLNGNQMPSSPLFKSLLSLQNPRLFGGDILLRMGQPQDGRFFKFERSAIVSPVSLWPNGVIFYELDPSVTHLARLIWIVMQQFHDETCIRFMPRLNNEPDFLRIEAHQGCFSYIGRVGGEQTLSLGDGCDYRGTIAHELLHAVGFFHHQNRSDRDEFLEILWENIAKGKEGQFEIMPPSEDTLLNEFDYNSIMLYGPHTFGKTLDKITMKPKREGVILLEVIEKQGLSALDVDSVNKLYKCEPYAYEFV